MFSALKLCVALVFTLGILLPSIEHCQASETEAVKTSEHACCGDQPTSEAPKKNTNNNHAECCPDGCACLFVGTSLIFPDAELDSTDLILSDTVPHYSLRSLISEPHLALPYQPPQV